MFAQLAALSMTESMLSVLDQPSSLIRLDEDMPPMILIATRSATWQACYVVGMTLSVLRAGCSPVAGCFSCFAFFMIAGIMPMTCAEVARLVWVPWPWAMLWIGNHHQCVYDPKGVLCKVTQINDTSWLTSSESENVADGAPD